MIYQSKQTCCEKIRKIQKEFEELCAKFAKSYGKVEITLLKGNNEFLGFFE